MHGVCGLVMIVSHQHKFIFIKTKKTAGTSLEISLSGICGPRDVITPITPADELIRKEMGHRGPQNFRNDGFNYFNHMAAMDVRQALGKDVWNTYFKFCFERNPWDKVISWYYWEIGQGRQMTFDEFMRSGHFTLVGGPGGFDLYTDERQEIIVDRVYLYENLRESLSDLARRFNVEAIPRMPMAKSGYRKDRKPYSDAYSDFHRTLVQRAFQREIGLFNYRF